MLAYRTLNLKIFFELPNGLLPSRPSRASPPYLVDQACDSAKLLDRNQSQPTQKNFKIFHTRPTASTHYRFPLKKEVNYRNQS